MNLSAFIGHEVIVLEVRSADRHRPWMISFVSYLLIKPSVRIINRSLRHRSGREKRLYLACQAFNIHRCPSSPS
jgi:hypothetical protein